MNQPLTWSELEELTDYEVDRVNGLTNAQATLRLFGQTESDVRVTLFEIIMLGVPTVKKFGCG